MSMIGHNNPPPEFIEPADFPSDMPKMHFFKCDIAALRKATIDKPLDIRGAYLAVLLAMYEHMEPLPADDRMAMMRTGIRDARLWRRVKGELIRLGLVVVKPSGRLSNSRFEDEITSYVTEFRNRQAAAIEREKKAKATREMRSSCDVAKPQLDDSYGLAKPQLEPSYPVANDQLKPSVYEKSNEINGRTTTIVPERSPQANHESRIRARDLERELDLERKKVSKETTPTHTSRMPRAADASSAIEDVWVCRDGEDEIHPGLFVGKDVIRHRGFTISIVGVATQLATANTGLSVIEATPFARDASIGHALQWAVDYDSGRRSDIPRHTANFIRGSIISQRNKQAAHQNAMTKPMQHRNGVYSRPRIVDPQAAARDALEEVMRRKEARKSQPDFIDATFKRVDQ